MSTLHNRIHVRQLVMWKEYTAPAYELTDEVMARACHADLNGTSKQMLAFVQLCAIELGTPPRDGERADRSVR